MSGDVTNFRAENDCGTGNSRLTTIFRWKEANAEDRRIPTRPCTHTPVAGYLKQDGRRAVKPAGDLPPKIVIMHAPSTRTLVVAAKDGSFNVVHDQDLPPLDDCSILVKTEAMAINPSDTKMLGAFQTPGAVLGTDFAGTVVAVGPKAKAGIAIGNRVCGASHGMNAHRPQHGAFASYVSTENDVWLRIPEGMSVEEGASLPAGLCTIGLALRALGLPTPDNPAQKPIKVLVYGGSTASGTLALQLLRLWVVSAHADPQDHRLTHQHPDPT